MVERLFGTPRRALIGYLIMAAFMVGAFVRTQQLVDENEARVVEIQEARLASCRQTYEGVREVLLPLFPAMPNPTQQKTLRTFNKTVNDLKAQCGKQTQTEEAP